MEPIQPEASIASTGKGIRYIGNWIYGYSGVIAVDNTETPLLEFVSGAGLIHAKVQPFYAEGSGGNSYFYQLYLNDIVVVGFASDGAVNPFGYGTTDIRVIIPPLTKVKFTAQNAASGDSNDQAVTLTGRVYGAA